MPFLIYHIRYHPPFFGLQCGFLLAPPELRLLSHCWTPGKSWFAPTARPFHKWQNGLAPAGPYWGSCHCYYPALHHCHSILHVTLSYFVLIIFISYPAPSPKMAYSHFHVWQGSRSPFCLYHHYRPTHPPDGVSGSGIRRNTTMSAGTTILPLGCY